MLISILVEVRDGHLVYFREQSGVVVVVHVEQRTHIFVDAINVVPP